MYICICVCIYLYIYIYIYISGRSGESRVSYEIRMLVSIRSDVCTDMKAHLTSMRTSISEARRCVNTNAALLRDLCSHGSPNSSVTDDKRSCADTPSVTRFIPRHPFEQQR